MAGDDGLGAARGRHETRRQESQPRPGEADAVCVEPQDGVSQDRNVLTLGNRQVISIEPMTTYFVKTYEIIGLQGRAGPWLQRRIRDQQETLLRASHPCEVR